MKRCLLVLSSFALALLPISVLSQPVAPPTFAEILRDYMSSRLDLTGHYDPEVFVRAAAHRDHMQPARMGGSYLTPNLYGMWQFVGPRGVNSATRIFNGIGPLSSRVTAIAADPTDKNTVYVGIAEAGLWKTTDNGLTWTNLSSAAPWKATTVSALAIDPKNPKIVYAGTGDFDGMPTSLPQGIMKSTDGGATWANHGSTLAGLGNMDVSKILIDPVNDNIVTCTTGNGPTPGSGGVFRSVDYGVTWTGASVVQSNYSGLDISVPAKDGLRTYWAVAGGNPGIIYTSVDQGRTWIRLRVYPPDFNPEPVLGLACSKVSPSTAFVLTPVSQKVFKTVDGGNTWQDITTLTFPVKNGYANNWADASYDYFLGTYQAAHATSGEVLFCGLYTLAYSVNDGATWVDYGQSYSPDAMLHVSQHQLALDPTDSASVFVGNDGGLFKLTFGVWSGSSPTITQTSLNNNMPVGEVYAVDPHPTDNTRVASGTNGSGSPTSIEGNLNTWPDLNQSLIGGSSAWDVQHNVVFTTGQNGIVDEYNSYGDFVKRLSSGFSNTAPLRVPIVASVDGSTLFSGGSTLYAYNIVTNSGWLPSLALSGAYVEKVVVCPSDPTRVYCGDSAGKVWMSKDTGASWKEIDNGALPPAAIGAMAVAPGDKNFLLVGFLASGIPHVWLTTTADSTAAWANESGAGNGALPDAPVSGLAVDSYQPRGTWYACSDVGVFMTKTIGAEWLTASAPLGLPNCVIYDLKATPNYLYAATFGRGVFRIPMVLPALIKKFVLTPNVVQGGAGSEGIVYLTNAPGSSGIYVGITTSNPAVTTPSVPVVYFGPGDIAKSFTIATQPVATNTPVTFTVTMGYSKAVATLLVKAATLTQFELGSKTIYGGDKMGALVTINQTATTNGYVVNLKSNSAAATPPASVTIPSGKTSLLFNIPTSQVAVTTNVTITATGQNGSMTGSFSVLPPAVSRLTFSPTTVICGNTEVGTVVMKAPAGTGGLTVDLSSDTPSVASVPATTKVGAGLFAGLFHVATTGVSANVVVNITASYNGTSVTTALTVAPASLLSVTSKSATVKGGTTMTANVNLNGFAPAPGGAVVALSSNNGAATVAASVKVLANQSTVPFTISTTPVTADTNVTITATYNGVSQTLQITVTP